MTIIYDHMYLGMYENYWGKIRINIVKHAFIIDIWCLHKRWRCNTWDPWLQSFVRCTYCICESEWKYIAYFMSSLFTLYSTLHQKWNEPHESKLHCSWGVEQWIICPKPSDNVKKSAIKLWSHIKLCYSKDWWKPVTYDKHVFENGSLMQRPTELLDFGACMIKVLLSSHTSISPMLHWWIRNAKRCASYIMYLVWLIVANNFDTNINYIELRKKKIQSETVSLG